MMLGRRTMDTIGGSYSLSSPFCANSLSESDNSNLSCELNMTHCLWLLQTARLLLLSDAEELRSEAHFSIQ